MSTELTWLGHNAWSIQAGGHRLLLDPFISDNPLCPIKADEVEADYILISASASQASRAGACRHVAGDCTRCRGLGQKGRVGNRCEGGGLAAGRENCAVERNGELFLSCFEDRMDY